MWGLQVNHLLALRIKGIYHSTRRLDASEGPTDRTSIAVLSPNRGSPIDPRLGNPNRDRAIGVVVGNRGENPWFCSSFEQLAAFE